MKVFCSVKYIILHIKKRKTFTSVVEVHPRCSIQGDSSVDFSIAFPVSALVSLKYQQKMIVEADIDMENNIPEGGYRTTKVQKYKYKQTKNKLVYNVFNASLSLRKVSIRVCAPALVSRWNKQMWDQPLVSQKGRLVWQSHVNVIGLKLYETNLFLNSVHNQRWHQ